MTRLTSFHAYWDQINRLPAARRQQLMNFGMGMPDATTFPIPKIILDQLKLSIEAGDYNKYIPTEGTADVLNEIVKLENRRLPAGAQPYTTSNVMLVPGGIQAFALLTEVLLKPFDTVLVPNPSYFSLTALCEERYKVKTLESVNFSFSAQQYREPQQLDNVRLAWLCNPNNPTGLFVPTQELAGIIECCADKGVSLIVDESCDNFIYGRPYHYPHNISHGNVIRIRTFSKDPNLAGYRLGYILGDNKVLEKAKRVSPILYGNPSVMAMRAIYHELLIKNGRLECRDYQETTARNHQHLYDARSFLFENLRRNSRVRHVILPDACYYMFAKLDFAAGSEVFTKCLLEQELVDVVPGTIFGMPSGDCWIRMCFARDLVFLEQALTKMNAVLTNLGP